MIIDSSALIAVLASEDDGEAYLRAMLADPAPKVPAPAVVETGMVASRLPDGGWELDRLLQHLDAEIVSFTAHHAVLARQAFSRYGRDSGHRAGLNFGDCLVYAVATAERDALLFKGNDFARTDITPVLLG